MKWLKKKINQFWANVDILISGYRWLNITIILYLGGHLWFALTAVFQGPLEWTNSTLYERYYFLWYDSFSYGWLGWCLLWRLSVKPYRQKILPVFLFSIFNFLWDCFSFTTGWGATHTLATGIFFLAGAAVVGYFIVKDIIKEWKS